MAELNNTTTEPTSTITEPVTEPVTTQEGAPSEPKGEPFRQFQTEEDFNKFVKSESMKRVNELYKELGVTNKDDIKNLIAYKSQFEDMSNKYTSLEKEYNDYKTSTATLQEENNKISRDLILQRLNISDEQDTREDFISSVEALSQRKNISFEDAAKEFAQRHPDYIANSLTKVKIGGEKSPVKEAQLSGVEQAFRKHNPWFKG